MDAQSVNTSSAEEVGQQTAAQSHLVNYVCKYTPIELLAAFGATCANLNQMPEGFDQAEELVGPNICGFGKSVLESVLAGEVHELVLVNCCDTIRSVYDVLEDQGNLDFLFLMDMLHGEGLCGRERIAAELKALAHAYGEYSSAQFDEGKFRAAFHAPHRIKEKHVTVLGARMGEDLFNLVQGALPYPVQNDSCVNNRSVGEVEPPHGLSFDELMDWYAGELLAQMPCMRMMDIHRRKQLYDDPNIVGIVYHTVKFCDFYSFEYADIKAHAAVPIVKIESDYTTQSAGQLLTRVEAFAESIAPPSTTSKEGTLLTGQYFAGIDSGSTSTDVVIIDADQHIVARTIIPTGAGATLSAEKALDQAIDEAGLSHDDVAEVVATGYGRNVIDQGSTESITEITCHARGAHHLDPSVRTVIDIGGQDSKVIVLDDDGNVENFAMNDKCAAGTGRFLEMMASTMQLGLDELARRGIHYSENVTISSTCSVFAESEVVSLVAQNKAVDDIVHGINESVASRTAALSRRVKGHAPYMMTGGVSRNEGLVKTLEKRLDAPIAISDDAQLCGALGAALFARDRG